MPSGSACSRDCYHPGDFPFRFNHYCRSLAGLDRATAMRYSFMLAAPVIFGATLLELKGLITGGLESALFWSYAAGTAAAFVAGILAIKIFIRLLQEQKFHYFAYYCWAVGTAVIIASLFF